MYENSELILEAKTILNLVGYYLYLKYFEFVNI